jgi:glycosyltransferase involved in cell wall biosynthesis
MVSIILPTYNSLQFLKERVNTILQQSYTHWECIVKDGQSNDSTWAYLEKVAAIDYRIVWDNVSGKVITYNLARNFFYKHDSLYNTKKVHDYCNSFINNIFSKKRDEHIASTQEKVMSVKKPFILFVAQVYNDASQLFTLDENISSPEEVIECVTNVAREIDCDLIIKLHPKEFNGKDPITREPYDHITYKRIKHLESEHTIIDYNNSYNTFELIKQSRMVVTVNSQAGLEACLFNKPVLTYSKGFYSNLGFTYDYSCKRDVRHLITNLIANEDIINRSLGEAKLFFYVFYEMYCIARSSNSLVNKTLEIGTFQKPHILYKIWSKLKYKINV